MTPPEGMCLTGGYRYRRGWFGSLRLEVQECWYFYEDSQLFKKFRWRRAKFGDLAPLREMHGNKIMGSVA